VKNQRKRFKNETFGIGRYSIVIVLKIIIEMCLIQQKPESSRLGNFYSFLYKNYAIFGTL